MSGAMQRIVGVSDMAISSDPDDVVVTHSLGSCVGVSMYDPALSVGGILHYQLPMSSSNPEKAAANPWMFGDTGIAAMLTELFRRGCEKRRLQVKLAGGATVADKNGFFNIGKKNILIAKKFFWKNGVFVEAKDLDGDTWRNMTLEIATGRLIIRSGAGEYELTGRDSCRSTS